MSHSLLVLALAYLFAEQAVAITHRERTATARKIKSSHKYRASGTGAGVRHPHAAPPSEFIYIYDLPSEFNEDLKELPVQWHPEQYDYDQVRRYAHLGSRALCCMPVHQSAQPQTPLHMP